MIDQKRMKVIQTVHICVIAYIYIERKTGEMRMENSQVGLKP